VLMLRLLLTKRKKDKKERNTKRKHNLCIGEVRFGFSADLTAGQRGLGFSLGFRV
jgi:hypothetical protein